MKRLLILNLVLLVAACDLSYFSSGTVGKAIRKELRDLEKQELILSEVTQFKWDELFLFDPYTPSSTICVQLGISENQCENEILEESMDEGEMYIVFRKNGIIVHKEMYIRFNGDFTPLNYTQPLTPDTAEFNVKRQGTSASGKPWLKLVLRSNRALQPTP